MYVEGQVPYVTPTTNNGFGGGEGWWFIIVLFALFGWGRNGYQADNGNSQAMYDLGRVATKDDLASGFANNTIIGNQNDIQMALCSGFNGINTSIMQSTNSLQSQLANCCCSIEKSLLENRYITEQNTCRIIQASNDNTQRLLDYFNAQELSRLRTELAQAQGQLSQNLQTATIINALRPTTTTTT